MRYSLTLLFVVALISSATSVVRADSAETAEYKEAVSLGLAEFEEKNFLEARAHFSRAHAIDPSARTLRALGMVNFELKNYVESAKYLGAALRSSERPIEADMRSKTEKLLVRAEGYIARLTSEIAPETRVSVDGKATDLSSGSEVVLAVGAHSLEFSAPGRITDRRTLEVQGGEQETLRVKLAAVGATTAGASSGDGVHDEKRPAYKKPWLWTALGVVLAGAAAGTAIALTRKTETTTEPPTYSGTSGVRLTGLSQ
jgi:tetratricopeptide (TPR) repeat protein